METKVKYKVKSKGLGTKPDQVPLTVRVSPHIDAIVRSLPERSDFLREAIAEKLKKEGLLPADTNQK